MWAGTGAGARRAKAKGSAHIGAPHTANASCSLCMGLLQFIHIIWALWRICLIPSRWLMPEDKNTNDVALPINGQFI